MNSNINKTDSNIILKTLIIDSSISTFAKILD